MKTKLALILMSLSLLAVACGTAEKAPETKGGEETAKNDAEKADAPKKDEEKKEEFTGDVEFPFEFPKVDTIAKKGEYVLVPSHKKLVDAMQKDASKEVMIWYTQKMEEPGEEASQVKFMSKTHKVPNGYIVPIPAGGTAKKGDIVLTWWQTGSGLQRAIVTDAKDPKAPTVRYLDLKYDNPAKDSKSGKGIGQTDYEIKPDSFYPINAMMSPGSSVAIGDDMKHGQVIRVKGDKVFVSLFAGRMGVFPRSDVKGVPIKVNVKAGDKVKAPFTANFSDATVTKVDAAIGRVWVKFDSGSEGIVAFGDIIPN